jgi:hypothetical protein
VLNVDNVSIVRDVEAIIIGMELRSCLVCHELKALSEFYRQPRRKDGLFPYCKPCSNHKSSQWRRDNPEANQAIVERSRERHRITSKAWKMKSFYGITREQYEAMLATQGGKCAIDTCGRDVVSAFSERRVPLKQIACIDHDHVSGKVRALLCNRCNYVVGCAEKHPDIIASAQSYIRSHLC